MKKLVLKLFGVIVASIVLLQAPVSMAASATSELENQKEANEQKIEENEQKKEEITAEKNQTVQEVEDISNQISSYESQIAELDTKIADLNTQISENEAKLAEAEEDYKQQEELLEKRLVASYEAGETSYLDFLLSSDGIVDFISNYFLVTEIATTDAELLDSIEQQKNEIEQAKTDLENDKRELDTSKAEKQSVATELEQTKSEKNAKVAKLTEDEQAIQAQIDELAEANKSLDAEILRKQQQIQEQLRKQQEQANKGNSNSSGGGSSSSTGGGSVSNSGFIYPVPSGYARITTGLYYSSGQYHGGVDFGSGGINGQPVYAVADGVVVTAKALTTSYGNYVIIAHSNGLYTLYAHGQMGSIRVSEGQYVSQGQQIMNVGSTGNSTGPHLHFEVRTSPGTYSNRVNPIPYLP